MKTIKTFLIIVLTILFTVTLKTHGEDYEKAKTSEDQLSKKEIARAKITQRLSQNFSIDDNGIPTRIKGHLSDGITATDPVDKAYQFFEIHKDIFQLEDPRSELVLGGVSDDKLGYNHVKLGQVVNGVPVGVVGYRVHIKPNGIIYKVKGQIDPEARNVDTNPGISVEAAKEIAISNLDPELEVDKFEALEPELIIARFDGEPKLTWVVNVAKLTTMYFQTEIFKENSNEVDTVVYKPKKLVREQCLFYIDARTGEILKKKYDYIGHKSTNKK